MSCRVIIHPDLCYQDTDVPLHSDGGDHALTKWMEGLTAYMIVDLDLIYLPDDFAVGSPLDAINVAGLKVYALGLSGETHTLRMIPNETKRKENTKWLERQWQESLDAGRWPLFIPSLISHNLIDQLRDLLPDFLREVFDPTYDWLADNNSLDDVFTNHRKFLVWPNRTLGRVDAIVAQHVDNKVSREIWQSEAKVRGTLPNGITLDRGNLIVFGRLYISLFEELERLAPVVSLWPQARIREQQLKKFRLTEIQKAWKGQPSQVSMLQAERAKEILLRDTDWLKQYRQDFYKNLAWMNSVCFEPYHLSADGLHPYSNYFWP